MSESNKKEADEIKRLKDEIQNNITISHLNIFPTTTNTNTTTTSNTKTNEKPVIVQLKKVI